MSFLNSSNLPLTHKLISKFPKLYILFKHKNNIKTALISIKGYESIKNKNLFDRDYYLKNNRNVKKSGMDPLLHYIYHGYKDNKKPNYYFDGDYYIKRYPDVNNTNLNPLIHYSLYGIKEGRIAHELSANPNFIIDPLYTLPYLESKNSLQNDYLKVGVFIEGNLTYLEPCPYLRLYNPLKHLSAKEKFKIFVYGKNDFEKVGINKIIKCKLFDVIIIQRGAMEIETSKKILKKCKDNNIKVIYEFDDDLLSLEKNNRRYAFYKKRSSSINYLIKNSDLLTVSSKALSERYNINKSSVVRNYLVNELKPTKSIKTKKNLNSISIGYYGTLTHDDDLLMIKKPMNKIINKIKEDYNIDVKFSIIGGINKKYDESWFNKVVIPHGSTEFVPFMKWIKNNVKFDIMIASFRYSRNI